MNVYKVYTFLKYIHACVCFYIYKIIIHTTHSYINTNFYFGCD